MEKETVNQEAAGGAANTAGSAAPAGQSGEKTFTQAELDRIVAERLSRDRAKYADYETLRAKAAKLDKLEEASKTELQKANERAAALETELNGMKQAQKARALRESVSRDTGVPAALLTMETEEDCREQAKAILEFARPSGYPSLRDGGEVGGTGKAGAREQFADWFNAL